MDHLEIVITGIVAPAAGQVNISDRGNIAAKEEP